MDKLWPQTIERKLLLKNLVHRLWMVHHEDMAAPQFSETVGTTRAALRTCITAVMGATGTTQTALAKVIGMDQGQLSKRLHADGPPFTEDHLARIADYFGVQVVELYQPDRILVSLRNRCFSIVPVDSHQMELSFLPEPSLLAV